MVASRPRSRAVLARAVTAFLLAAVAGALASPPVYADGGTALLEIGRVSDGGPTNVNPATVLANLAYNEGAGGRFGAEAPSTLGGSATFTFTPPAGTTIVGSRVWPRVAANGWPAMGAWTDVTSSWGNFNVGGNPGVADVNGLWAQGGGGMATGPVASLSATATQWSYGSGVAQVGYFYADKLDVTLNDAAAPSVDEAPGDGALFGAPDASGWYTAAILPVTLKASDDGLGVRWLLLKDGATVHRIALPGTGASCATKDPDTSIRGGDSYTTKVPCPTATASYTVDVDLRTLGDGVRSLQLGVMDASGRTSYGAAYTAKVNAPGGALGDPGAACAGGTFDASGTCQAAPVTPPGGGGVSPAGGVTPVAGPAISTPASALGLTQTPPPSPAPPTPTAAADRRGNGSNASAAASLSLRFNGQPTRRVSVAYGQSVVVTGQLAGRGAKPIAGARIALSTVKGRAVPPLDAVTTDADGTFRAVIPPGASRTIRFAYRAFADDADDADTADLEIGVRTVAHLRATPRALRNGDTVAFSGRVEGAPAGSRKVVEMQVWQDRRWLTFATTRLHGPRFAYRYRFTRTRTRTRYVFRTVVRTDAGWPYETGSSNRVSVEVRP
jgi:hypothetical protein